MSSKASVNKCGTRWWEWILAIIGVPMLALLLWLWLRRRAKEGTPPITPMRIDITTPFSPTETPELTAEEPHPTPDDLKHIDGIGPRISSVLQAAGIRTFAQLAETDIAQLKDILKDAGIRANPSTWPDQASLATVGQ
jgi:nucleotidyltransferase/DNA polymerase involved in DNA repair